jgi:hypothetical protein
VAVRRIVVIVSLAAVGVLVLASIAGGVYLRSLNHLLDNRDWLTKATPAQQKSVSEQILLVPYGDHHTAFQLLERYGDVDSIPYLLRGLSWEPDPAVECTTDHGLDALRRITGHNAGDHYADWRKWWDEEGSRLPASAFPLAKS